MSDPFRGWGLGGGELVGKVLVVIGRCGGSGARARISGLSVVQQQHGESGSADPQLLLLWPDPVERVDRPLHAGPHRFSSSRVVQLLSVVVFVVRRIGRMGLVGYDQQWR